LKLSQPSVKRLAGSLEFIGGIGGAQVAACAILLGIACIALGWIDVLPATLPGDEVFNAERVAGLTLRSLVGWPQPPDAPSPPTLAADGIDLCLIGLVVLLVGAVTRAARPVLSEALIRSARDIRLVVSDDAAGAAVVAEPSHWTTVLLGDAASSGTERPAVRDRLDDRFLDVLLPRCAGNTRSLLALGRDSNANIQLARRLIALRRGQANLQPLDQLMIRIDSRELRSAMGREGFSEFADAAADVQFTSLPEARCRNLLREQPPNKVRLVNRRGHATIVIVGLGETGLELLVRLCAQAQSPHSDPLYLTLVDTEARTVAREFLELWPALALAVELVPIPLEPRLPQSASSLFRYLNAESLNPTCIYLTLEDDALAVAWEREIGLAVRLSARESPLVLSLSHETATDGGLLAADETLDLLQRELHVNYLRARNGEGRELPPVDWSRVSFDFQEDNRSVADHLWAKAKDLDCRIRPASDGGAEIMADATTSGPHIERMAAAEHRRWIASRAVAGWRFGAVHSESERTHPSLVPWQALPAAEQTKDRSVIRQMPSVLRAGGLLLQPSLGLSVPRGRLSESNAERVIAEAKHRAQAARAIPHLIVALEDARGFRLAKRLAATSDLLVSLVLAQPISGLAAAAQSPATGASELARAAHALWITEPAGIDEILSRWPALEATA